MNLLKKISVVLIITLIHQFSITSVMAQTPNQFKYQAVLRDASGNILANQNVKVDIAILQGSASGTSVFSETHNVTTSAQGLINLNIGSVSDLSVVDFSADTYFVQITVDGTIMGTSQLLSVPYALTAKNVETVHFSQITDKPTTISDYGITDAFDGSYANLTNKPDLTVYATKNMNNENITNLAEPVNAQDAATKAYVDTLKARIDALETQMVLNNGVTDIDGNHYPIVKIGNQIWMTENLRVTKYPNGTAIPYITDSVEWGNLPNDNTGDAYSFYNNDKTIGYGALYTYAAAIGDDWAYDNVTGQGVCPDGWHLPTDAEWAELIDYLGGSAIAGAKLKEAGTMHWSSPNTGATNESGFSALPGGYRFNGSGSFYGIGLFGNYWSATEINSSETWVRAIDYNLEAINRHNNSKAFGFSVRCIKN